MTSIIRVEIPVTMPPLPKQKTKSTTLSNEDGKVLSKNISSACPKDEGKISLLSRQKTSSTADVNQNVFNVFQRVLFNREDSLEALNNDLEKEVLNSERNIQHIVNLLQRGANPAILVKNQLFFIKSTLDKAHLDLIAFLITREYIEPTHYLNIGMQNWPFIIDRIQDRTTIDRILQVFLNADLDPLAFLVFEHFNEEHYELYSSLIRNGYPITFPFIRYAITVMNYKLLYFILERVDASSGIDCFYAIGFLQNNNFAQFCQRFPLEKFEHLDLQSDVHRKKRSCDRITRVD